MIDPPTVELLYMGQRRFYCRSVYFLLWISEFSWSIDFRCFSRCSFENHCASVDVCVLIEGILIRGLFHVLFNPPLESIEGTKGARQNLSCLSILSQSRTQKSILKQCKLIPLKFRWNLCWSFRNVSHYYRQQSSGLLSLRRSEDERNLAFLGLNRKIKYYKKLKANRFCFSFSLLN